MSFQRNFLGLIIISLAILGFGCSQRISIPLKIDIYGQLQFSTQFGNENKCQVDFTPVINYCMTNIITKKAQEIEYCGSQKIGKSNFIEGTIYTSPFFLRDIKAPLSFIIPPPMTDLGNSICFGYNDSAKEENTLAQLFKDGKISEKRVSFSLNSSLDKDQYIGEMHIGTPNSALIKKDAKLIELAASFGNQAYTAISDARIEFLGNLFFSSFKVLFLLETPYHEVPQSVFDNMVSIFKELGIKNNYDPNYSKDAFLFPSIEKLQPIKLTLLQKDKSQFHLTLKPSQYTRPYGRSTQYQFLIRPNSKLTSQFNLSYKVFESYYVGFNLEGQSIFIAEKEEKESNNFRRSSTFD